MKTQITLAVALAFVCSSFAFAQDTNRNIERKVKQEISSRYETPSQVRERVLAELAAKTDADSQAAYRFLKVKNDLINHYRAGKMSEAETRAIEAYKCGQIYEAYEALGFNLHAVVKDLDALNLYQPSFTLTVFAWPVTPQYQDNNAYLEVARVANARKITLEVMQEKVNELAPGTEKRALREYALSYYQTMNELLNRYAIDQSTEQDKQALAQYKRGDVREAYNTLGFQLDKVVKAVEAVEFWPGSMHPTFFQWPEKINWNNK